MAVSLLAAQAYDSGLLVIAKNRNSEAENPSECGRLAAGFGA
jgi:hypothetical protein